MTLDQQARFREIRLLLKAAYDDYFKRSDGYCKSAEMYVEVYYPNYWESEDFGSMEATGLGIYSYVLGPHRMHHFNTFDEALETVRGWHRDQLASEDESC